LTRRAGSGDEIAVNQQHGLFVIPHFHLSHIFPGTARVSRSWFGRSAQASTGLSAFLFTVFLSACSKDPSTPTLPPTGLSVVEMDSLMVLNSLQSHRLAIKVYPANLAVGREMRCQIRGGLVSTHFMLYDDGGFGRWNDALGFADSVSGDAIPGDGIYTRTISNQFTMSAGDYPFSFALNGIPPPDTLEVIVKVRANTPPSVSALIAPDSILSGVSGLEFEAVIADPDGYGDVRAARLYRLVNDLPQNIIQMTRLDSLAWNWSSTPDIAAGTPSGYYRFVVEAQDYYLERMQEWAPGTSDSCWLENLPPSVSSVAGPDTVWIPPQDTVSFYYVISVRDDQGNGDLKSLELDISRPDRPDTLFYYYDNGVQNRLQLDSIAGDGRFVPAFSADSTSRTGVLFTFTWTPVDWALQNGESFRTTLIFMSGERAAVGRNDLHRKEDLRNLRLYRTKIG
jgi:hypothetical protein